MIESIAYLLTLSVCITVTDLVVEFWGVHFGVTFKEYLSFTIGVSLKGNLGFTIWVVLKEYFGFTVVALKNYLEFTFGVSEELGVAYRVL